MKFQETFHLFIHHITAYRIFIMTINHNHYQAVLKREAGFTWVHREVGTGIFFTLGVIPEVDRHGGEWLQTDQFSGLPIYRLTYNKGQGQFKSLKGTKNLVLCQSILIMYQR